MAAGPVPDGSCPRKAVVYFSPARAAARAFLPAVVCFFGTLESIPGEALRVSPMKGMPARQRVVTGPERP